MKSYLQAHAEMSRLDDSAAMERRRSGGSNNSSADLHQHHHQHQPVIPHLKEKYDPEHPDADWAGNVHRSYKKKAQYSDHSATRQNLVADEKGGIMPDAHAASTATSSFSGKKLFDAHQLPVGDPSVPGIKFQSAVYQVGPGADISCSNWKTSYEAQTSAETTPQDVYALGSRQNTQHRRHVTPMYEKTARGTHGDNNYAISSTFSSSSSPSSSRGSSPVPGAPLHASGSSGSLSGRRIEPRKSLLAGIGKLVAADDVGDKLVRPEHHLSQGYTDPTKKILIAENHHNITLGYTGRKSSFR